MTWPDNPFPFGIPVDEDGIFQHRNSELGDMQAETRNLRRTLIRVTGPRRMGKTSLLLRFKRLMASEMKCFYLDLRRLLIAYGQPVGYDLAVRLTLDDLASQLTGQEPPPQFASPAEFRKTILTRVARDAAPQRLAILLDEADVLEDRYPAAIEQILAALLLDSDCPPVVVYSSGRPIGAPRTTALGYLFKGAFPIEVVPFTKEETYAVPKKAQVYALSVKADDNAETALYEVTGGHPFWIAAINFYIFKNRKDKNRVSPVGRKEVFDALAPSAKNASGDIWQAWQYTRPLQSVISRAVADLTWDATTRQFGGVADVFQIRQAIKDVFAEIDDEQIRRALSALADDFIVRLADGDKYALHAPFLGHWLVQQKLSDLRLSGDPQARERLADAHQLKAAGDSAGALEALTDALAVDGQLTEALLLAGQLEAADDSRLDSAIWHLETAARGSPDAARGLLVDVLVRRIERAAKNGENPDPWYYKVADFDPQRADSEPVTRAVVKYYLDRWERLSQSETSEAANACFEALGNHKLPHWRDMAAERYHTVLSVLLQSRDSLRQIATAIRGPFCLLNEQVIAPAVVSTSDSIQALIDRVPDPTSREIVAAHFAEQQDRYPWWTITIIALARVLEEGLPDENSAWVPLRVVHDLVRLCPGSLRDELVRTVIHHASGRLASLVAQNPQEAVQAVRIICEHEPAAEEVIGDALETAVLRATELADQDFVDFFRRLPSVYLVWAEYQMPGTRTAAKTLDQIDVLIDRLTHPRGPTPADTNRWELVVRAADSLEKWRDVLSHRIFRSERSTQICRRLSSGDSRIERAISLNLLGLNQAVDKAVVGYLSEQITNPRPMDVRIPGIPSGAVRFYRGLWNDQHVNLKVYHLSPDSRSRDFFAYLWENERRALLHLGTKVSGRALTRFRFARQVSDSAYGDFLIVGTEAAGPRTVRDQLIAEGRTGLLGPSRKRDLWRAIHALLQSVNALHRSHYLHRAIRPENIFINPDADIAPLKLANFEWSVYLHSLADRFPQDERWLDRYTAPEVLSGRFHKGSRDSGEGFGSDVYSLGLVLFELLVRQFTADELGRYYTAQDYDARAHHDWLLRLRKEAAANLSGPDDTDSRLLVLEMLEPTVALRRADIDDLVQLAAQIAWAPHELEQSLTQHCPYIATILTPNTAASIRGFLEPFLRPGELGCAEAEVRRFLEREVSGARIYRNSNPDRPLIIDGRRIAFTVAPFAHDFRQTGKSQEAIPEIPFLTVATALDRKEGTSLAKLPGKTEIVNLSVAHRDLDRHVSQVLYRGAAWRRLFELAASSTDGLSRESREFYTILQTTAEVEEQLWKKNVGRYRVISRVEAGPRRTMIITDVSEAGSDRGRSGGLARLIAGQSARGERFFELGPNLNPLGPLQYDRVWALERVSTGQGTIQLYRDGGDWPPEEGFIRPQSMVGFRAVRQRRLEALQHLRDDEYLLRAITHPASVKERSSVGNIEYFDSGLDTDKRRIVRNVLETPPLFLVQGPPGTGKTTLAAEVIRQTLARNPSARVLITSQAHEPLNNLLSRVDEAFRSVEPSKRPAAVRVLSSARLQSRRWSEETREVMRRFHPAEVARQHVGLAKRWVPSSESRLDATVVHQWREWIDHFSKQLPLELERRISASANLVYATANDKSISDVPEERDFDLLIFEEAAKAYPLEVLGPMRLARRWLLIGDHEQLSAFNIEEFRDVAGLAVQQLFDGSKRTGSFTAPITRGLGLRPESKKLAIEAADFFEYLFRRSAAEELHPFVDRLSLQWRMHPGISRMLREIYYDFLRDGDITALGAKKRHRIVSPAEFRGHSLVWVDVEPEEPGENRSLQSTDEALAGEVPFAGGGFRNPYEARVLHNVMSSLQASGRGGLHGNVVFLSPYKAQVDLINRFFRSWDAQRNPNTGDLRQSAYTVDSFQGRQAEIVAVSLVRNNRADGAYDAYGFLYGDEGRSRSAVMFSRAERLLIIIGCSAHFRKDKKFHIASVYEHIQRHGLVIPAKTFLRSWDYEEMRRHQVFRDQQRGEAG